VKGSQGGRGYDSDMLLEGRIIANELLFCFLCLILRLREARISMTYAKEVAPEKVKEPLDRWFLTGETRLPGGVNKFPVGRESLRGLQHGKFNH